MGPPPAESRSTPILVASGRAFSRSAQPILLRSSGTFLDRSGLTKNHQGGKTGGVAGFDEPAIIR